MQIGTLTPLQLQQLIVAVIGGAAFVVIIVLFVRMRRRMANEHARTMAQAEADATLRGFRSRLNYASQLLNSERDRMRYDRVRYSNSDADIMAEHLQDAEQRYQSTKTALEHALRQLPDTAEVSDYQHLIHTVNELAPSIAPIEAALQHSIHHRSVIDTHIQQCTERLDAIQREQQQLHHRLATLGINHRAMLHDAEHALTRANELMAGHLYTDALTYAEQASQQFQTVNSHITTLHDIRNGVLAGRQASEKAALQGYDVSESLRLFQEASTHLDRALAMMMAGNSSEGAELVTRAEQLRQQAVIQGGSQPAIQQRHNDMLAEIVHAGEQLRLLFQQAAFSFQQLKNAHIQLWDDLVHAGSEAVVNAHYAAYYVELTQKPRTLKRDDIATVLLYAQQSLHRAIEIVQIIIQRFDDVQRMELIARQEYADAEELIDLIQMQVNAGEPTVVSHYPVIKQEFLAVQQCVDKLPFDSMSSYRMARQFIQRTLAVTPLEVAQSPLHIAERSQRIRDMLWRQIRILEQFNVLYPIPDADTLVRGLQSIRHEANAFDITWTTASDMTIPIISELSKLIQRYDRLDNAIIHIGKQLRNAANQLRKQQLALFAALNSTITRIRTIADDQTRLTALQRLRELDTQLELRTITYDTALTQLHTLAEALPHDVLAAPTHAIDPFPYLRMRYFAKVGSFEPTASTISWVPNLPADPEW